MGELDLLASPARQRLAARFDMSLVDNQRKLQAVEQLAEVADEAGVSLMELAIAFVVNHPAVTSAIIGPRTMDQLDSQLPAADITLDTALLDRIDEIVQPGVNVNPADTSYGEQVLKSSLLRHREVQDRPKTQREATSAEQGRLRGTPLPCKFARLGRDDRWRCRAVVRHRWRA